MNKSLPQAQFVYNIHFYSFDFWKWSSHLSSLHHCSYVNLNITFDIWLNDSSSIQLTYHTIIPSFCFIRSEHEDTDNEHDKMENIMEMGKEWWKSESIEIYLFDAYLIPPTFKIIRFSPSIFSNTYYDELFGWLPLPHFTLSPSHEQSVTRTRCFLLLSSRCQSILQDLLSIFFFPVFLISLPLLALYNFNIIIILLSYVCMYITLANP